MDGATRDFVWSRAGNLCEYCRIAQSVVVFSFHVEHVIAKQHFGSDDPSNLALACDRCNLYKGTNLSAIDPETGNIVRLFNPRRDLWPDHFSLDGAKIIGLTEIGRATVRLLNMNAPNRVALRAESM